MKARFASPILLRGGRWGVRVSWRARVGDIVDVRSVEGKIWQTRIAAILWTDHNDDSLVCATRPCKQQRRKTRERGPVEDAQLGETLPDGRLSAYAREAVEVGDRAVVVLEDGRRFLARVDELVPDELSCPAGWTCFVFIWTDTDA